MINAAKAALDGCIHAAFCALINPNLVRRREVERVRMVAARKTRMTSRSQRD